MANNLDEVGTDGSVHMGETTSLRAFFLDREVLCRMAKSCESLVPNLGGFLARLGRMLLTT